MLWAPLGFLTSGLPPGLVGGLQSSTVLAGTLRDAHLPLHRKIMDSGELDFYQHDRVCSNTCRSTKIDLSGARASLGSPTPAEYIPLTPATADGTCWPSADPAGPGPVATSFLAEEVQLHAALFRSFLSQDTALRLWRHV